MSRRKDLVFWNIPVPKSLDIAVEKAVKDNRHVTKSEFVREACRKLLEEVEIGGEERKAIEVNRELKISGVLSTEDQQKNSSVSQDASESR